MKRFSGSAIPRYQVFTLSDGTFVVQWGEDRVQELLTGQYRHFDYKRDFGHAITNYELAQLRTSGRVEYYNRHYIWMYPLPEAGRFGQRRVLDRGDRIRAYYIATQLPSSEAQRLTTLFDGLGITIKTHEDFIALFDAEGLPFETLEEAEAAQKTVIERASEVVGDLSIAFLETKKPILMPGEDKQKLDLDEIIASQQDTSITAGKLVILALLQEDEIQAFSKLLHDMQIETKQAETSEKVMLLLEDYPANLFIMDIDLPDLHGWKMISKIREVDQLRDLPITIITNQPNFGATVANVSYLVRPVSIARLRHNIWTSILHSNQTDKEQ